jgi:hypothetical protein
MANKCGIEDLRMELFDTLQRLKSNNDKNCSPNEKCSIEEAEAVCHIAKEITETYKVQLQAMNILSKADNPNRVQLMIEHNGL